MKLAFKDTIEEQHTTISELEHCLRWAIIRVRYAPGGNEDCAIIVAAFSDLQSALDYEVDRYDQMFSRELTDYTVVELD